jgi:hypothetical protein
MGRYGLDRKPAAKTSLLVWIVLLAALAAGGAYYFMGREPAPAAVSGDSGSQQVSIELAIPQQNSPASVDVAPGTTTPPLAGAVLEQQTAAAVASENPVNSTADLVLPELKNSDAVFKDDVGKLSSGLTKWLNAEQLITRYLTLVNDVSQGQRLYKHANFLHLDKPFTPKRNAYGLYMEASDYSRYDSFAAAIEALDVQACMAFYKKYRPLMQEVFATFSYPHNYHIEDIIQKAGANILLAPLIDRPVGLVPHGNRYRFADPQLEGLNPVQKQMLRMGPENTRRIQDKVRLLLQALAA